jgi:Coenzyme PQQ synthesis protein D (PqqD)
MDTPLSKPLDLAEESLIWREVDGQVIVLDKRTWSYLSINDSGARLWREIARGASRAKLIACLQETYELDEQSASRDVEDFISMMQAHGMLCNGNG